MAIFYPPPQPFMGSGQPLVPNKNDPGIPGQSVNNPPFDRRRMEALVPYPPPPWPMPFMGGWQPYAPERINGHLITIDNPPFDSRHMRDVAAMLATQTVASPFYQLPYKQVITANLAFSRGFIIG